MQQDFQLHPHTTRPFAGGAYTNALGKRVITDAPDGFLDHMDLDPRWYPPTRIYNIIYRRAYCQELQQRVQGLLEASDIDAAVTVNPGRRTTITVGTEPVSRRQFGQIYLAAIHELEEELDEGGEPFYGETMFAYEQIDPGWRERQEHPEWRGESPQAWAERTSTATDERVDDSDEDWSFETLSE